MKKTFISIASLVLTNLYVFAGGVITNTNQSSQFIRMASRSASIDYDAVYFNPAATAQVIDGFHISYGHQICLQSRTTTDDFPTLNRHEYKGDIFVPAYPTLHAIWKKNNLAISFGFGPNGGGGSATYDNGLASFERTISLIPSMVTAAGVPTSNYTANISFEGGSVLYGGQLGVAYSFLDKKLAASIGARFIYGKNTYKGGIKDIKINPNMGGLNGLDGTVFISAQQFFNSIGLTAQAAAVADKDVDAVQTAFGIAPIVGISYMLNNRLNFGLKYEFKTNLEFTNDTKKDDTGMFTDDSTFHKDIPAIFSLGVGYKITDKFRGQLSYTQYFDKQCNWEGREKLMDHNTMDLALGLEYDVIPLLTLSAGYSRCFAGATSEYETDMDFSLSSNSFGIGGRLHFTEKLQADFGFMYVSCIENDKTSVDASSGISHKETYVKDNKLFTLGLSYSF